MLLSCDGAGWDSVWTVNEFPTDIIKTAFLIKDLNFSDPICNVFCDEV